MSRSRGPADRGVGASPGGTDAPAGASGPLVALCVGQRCSALRRLARTVGARDESPDAVENLRSAVRATSGAVLLMSPCLGPCSLASVAAIAHRDGATGHVGRPVWLAGMEQLPRAAGLQRWVVDGGPTCRDRPDAEVPGSLAEAAVGVGPGLGPGVASWVGPR